MIATQSSHLRMDEFDYDLPADLIAQEPLAERSSSRLMVLDRSSGGIDHRMFEDLPSLLRPGDLLVVNDSRVLPARLIGRRETGASIEVFLLRPAERGSWIALAKPARRLRVGERLIISPRDRNTSSDATLVIREKIGDGQVVVSLDDHLSGTLEKYGRVPLPPYITHQLDDDERYQTVYARRQGSVAAPTAGLHFTDEVFSRLRSKDIEVAPVTLHVGLDTFRPVTEAIAGDHKIHSEWCSVSAATWRKIQNAKARGGRVVAVGTTSARTLESLGERVAKGTPGPFEGFTRVYIKPGYEWKMVDALLTNFHLPKSTLLLMISALAGRENVLAAYQEAIAREYRFFSFGDAMLIA